MNHPNDQHSLAILREAKGNLLSRYAHSLEWDVPSSSIGNHEQRSIPSGPQLCLEDRNWKAGDSRGASV